MPATKTIKAQGVAPMLTVNDLQKSIQYYQDLGFAIEERYEHEGALVGVRMAGGQGRLNLSQDDWAKGKDRVKGTGVRLFVPVDQDVDAYAADLEAAGITLEAPPQDQPWGRFIMLTDPDGYKITVARLR